MTHIRSAMLVLRSKPTPEDPLAKLVNFDIDIAEDERVIQIDDEEYVHLGLQIAKD